MGDMRGRSPRHYDDVVPVLRSCVSKPENVYVWTSAALQAADDIEDMRVAGSRLCDILLAIEADGYLDLSDQELLAIKLWREASGE